MVDNKSCWMKDVTWDFLGNFPFWKTAESRKGNAIKTRTSMSIMEKFISSVWNLSSVGQKQALILFLNLCSWNLSMMHINEDCLRSKLSRMLEADAGGITVESEPSHQYHNFLPCYKQQLSDNMGKSYLTWKSISKCLSQNSFTRKTNCTMIFINSC